MSRTYVIVLLSVVVVALLARVVLPALPIRGRAVRLSIPEALAVVVGSVSLVLHCGAMFFRVSVASWPLGPTVIRVVDPMGTASITWFAVGAALIVIGLCRQQPIVVAIVAASLVGVGYTMYDGGSLRTHLDTIAVAVVLLAASVAVFADPPWRTASLTPEPTPR